MEEILEDAVLHQKELLRMGQGELLDEHYYQEKFLETMFEALIGAIFHFPYSVLNII